MNFEKSLRLRILETYNIDIMIKMGIFNITKYKEQYVTLTDIKSLNPCWFKDKKNPLTGKSCPTNSEGFQNRYENNYKTDTLPSGIICKAYYTTLCLMLLYLFYKIASKKK